MLSAIQNLRDVALLCHQGQPLGDRLGEWLACSLDAFLAHQAATIDEALGIRSPRGGVPWWREEAIRVRDGLLRDFAGRYFADLAVAAKARRIRLLALRYGATAWRFDRARDAMPTQYQGTQTAWLWQLFRSGAPIPVSERHLRTILGGGKSGSPGDGRSRATARSAN